MCPLQKSPEENLRQTMPGALPVHVDLAKWRSEPKISSVVRIKLIRINAGEQYDAMPYTHLSSAD